MKQLKYLSKTLLIATLITAPAWSNDDDRGCSGESKTFCNLKVTGAATVCTLFVNGNETVRGNVNIGGSLSVTGPAYFTSIFINGVPFVPTPPVTNAFVQGGNTFGTTGVLGLNDANNLTIRTDSTTRITITTNGAVNIAAPTAAGNDTLTVTANATDNALVVVGGTGAAAETITAAGTQTALDILAGNINLTDSTDANTGNITKGIAHTPFIHNFDQSGFNNNTFVGLNAGNFTMTGSSDTGFGFEALTLLDNGSDNTAVGVQALASNVNGSFNTAVGNLALNKNTDSDNTAVGDSALRLTTGHSNTAVGSSALELTTARVENTALGYFALRTNDAPANTAVGAHALRLNTTGERNTAVGAEALRRNTTTNSNTAVGYFALTNNTIGDSNTALGANTALTLTTGSSNIIIGSAANVDAAARTNCILIGTGATTLLAAANNQIRIGFGTTLSDSCYIDGIFGKSVDGGTDQPVIIDSTGKLGTTTSSRRYKENIRNINNITDNFMQLNPVEFTYKSDASHTPQYGLIAEEVESVFPELVVYNKDGQVESVKYHLLYAFFIKMIQEHEAKIAELQNVINTLQQA